MCEFCRAGSDRNKAASVDSKQSGSQYQSGLILTTTLFFGFRSFQVLRLSGEYSSTKAGDLELSRRSPSQMTISHSSSECLERLDLPYDLLKRKTQIVYIRGVQYPIKMIGKVVKKFASGSRAQNSQLRLSLASKITA